MGDGGEFSVAFTTGLTREKTLDRKNYADESDLEASTGINIQPAMMLIMDIESLLRFVSKLGNPAVPGLHPHEGDMTGPANAKGNKPPLYPIIHGKSIELYFCDYVLKPPANNTMNGDPVCHQEQRNPA